MQQMVRNIIANCHKIRIGESSIMIKSSKDNEEEEKKTFPINQNYIYIFFLFL